MYILVVFPNSTKRYMYYSPYPVSVGDFVLVHVGSGSTKKVKVVEINVSRDQAKPVDMIAGIA